MSQTAFEHGYHLRILGVDDDYGGLEPYLNACVESGVAGFLVYGRCEPGDAQLYKNLIDSGVPVVMVDRYVPELTCDHVVYDNEAASHELTLKLLVRGHRTIAVLPGQELTTTAVQDRLRGHRRALADAGVGYDEDLVWLDLYGCYLPRQGRASAPQGGSCQRLRERLDVYQPSAIFTINDIIATYLVHDLLHLRGAPVSEDGSYDVELATFSAAPTDFPYPTAVAVHPAARLGRAATELLLGRLDKTFQGAPRHQVIPMAIAAPGTRRAAPKKGVRSAV